VPIKVKVIKDVKLVEINAGHYKIIIFCEELRSAHINGF